MFSNSVNIFFNTKSISIYYLLVFIISLSSIGITTSTYLSFAHYLNFTNLEHQSFCAISKSLNCDTVAQSPYSIFINIPIATWGIIGYLFFSFFLLICNPRKTVFPGTTLLFIISCIFSLVSLALALVTTLKIHSYCIVCIFTYGVNFCLLLVTFMAQGRFGQGSFLKTLLYDLKFLQNKKKQFATLLGALITALTICLLFYPRYWLFAPFPENTNIEHGITEDGSPWIGAQNPSITITEYADYLCFQCGKMHHHLRHLINQYPDQIRLVHRHFPLDSKVNPLIKDDVHPNSGLLSFFAIAAQKQDLFWQVNDALFREARAKQSISFSTIAQETGMNLVQFQEKLKDPQLHQKLAGDIRSGLRLNITATPSYVVNGTVYSGTLPKEVIESALKNAK